MSPLTMALIALLAYKGYKHFGGSQPAGSGVTGRPRVAAAMAASARAPPEDREVAAAASPISWAGCSAAAASRRQVASPTFSADAAPAAC